jgi:Nrap protein domain 1
MSVHLQELFQEKDYLNGRFFQKRAFHLVTIATAITSKSKLNVDISYYSLSEPLEKVLSIKHFICCPYNSLDGSHNDFA